jgi:hypothetical protein
MKRREFVGASLTAAAAIALRKSLAQTSSKNRAAVVIGVDKVGDLPKLKAASSGAASVAQWLSGEGFEVKLLSDVDKPVKASDVFDTISALVNRGTLEQLVIYFAGHGFLNSYSEYWLLSGAPDNPNEAISVNESVFLAKQTAIPNVVIISDACRSKADSLRTERVRGSLVFPNSHAPPQVTADVDILYATLVGDPSWEVSVQESTTGYEGIFTATLLDAYRRPDASMVSVIKGSNVVPNARLKPYLSREVPLRAHAASILITQRPDIQVVSGDATYIARVKGADRLPTTAATPPATLGAVATASLERLDSGIHLPAPGPWKGGPALPDALSQLAEVSGFTEATHRIIESRGAPEAFLGRTGFAIFGQRLASVSTVPGMQVKPANISPDRATVELNVGGGNSASVGLRFADGTGCVLAALGNFIGNVVVDDHGVSSVTYEPSHSNIALRSEYERDAGRLDALHATVATAARFGVFRIEGGKKNRQAAAQMGDRIRVMKGIDATLGLYAAYAYASADLTEQVISVNGFMHALYAATFFDVAMLAGTLSGKHVPVSGPQVPFCPMLSQGWSLLRVKDVRLPEGMEIARDHLRSSLWTTFDGEGMRIVEGLLLQRTQA